MQLLLLAIRRAQNLETIIEDGFEDNGNDGKFFCFFSGRDFKTKQHHPASTVPAIFQLSP